MFKSLLMKHDGEMNPVSFEAVHSWVCFSTSVCKLKYAIKTSNLKSNMSLCVSRVTWCTDALDKYYTSYQKQTK